MNTSEDYRVQAVWSEGGETATLLLQPNSPTIAWRAGQYINVYVSELSTPEGKAYSISSAPGEYGNNQFTITVLAMGQFSDWLVSRKMGDVISGSRPYGFFYSETVQPLVLVAGGIGVTPFRALIAENKQAKYPREIALWHSGRMAEDLVFYSYFTDLVGRFAWFSYYPFQTQEPNCGDGVRLGRFSAQDIVAGNAPVDTEFFLCGSISMVRELWQNLRQAGISEYQIQTEAFFVQ